MLVSDASFKVVGSTTNGYKGDAIGNSIVDAAMNLFSRDFSDIDKKTMAEAMTSLMPESIRSQVADTGISNQMTPGIDTSEPKRGR